MEIQISSNAEAVRSRLRQREARLLRAVDRRVNLAVNRRALQGYVPVATGRLRRSLRVKQYARRAGVRLWRVSLGDLQAPYARWVKLRGYGRPARGLRRLVRDRVKRNLVGLRVELS